LSLDSPRTSRHTSHTVYLRLAPSLSHSSSARIWFPPPPADNAEQISDPFPPHTEDASCSVTILYARAGLSFSFLLVTLKVTPLETHQFPSPCEFFFQPFVVRSLLLPVLEPTGVMLSFSLALKDWIN